MDVAANIIVTGAPRSGTSLVAGLFVAAGSHPGDRLIPATASNPAGFFEALDVNAANDDLLEVVANEPAPGTVAPPRQLRWLGAYDRPVPFEAGDGLNLSRWVPKAPFVLKDPRFSYTLPAWRRVLGGVRVVVVVRHPSEVAASVAAMAAREPTTFTGFAVTTDHVLAMWQAVYDSVLTWCGDETTFVLLDDVHDGSACLRLERATGIPVGAGGVRSELRRERTRDPLPGSVAELFAVLEQRCRREL